MILLDSYAAGGETIVELEGGTLLIGDNGAGKSSLLSIISLFYGELPNRCKVGSDNFDTFYMARATSYIIFEYLRRDSRCMAIMFSDGNGVYSYRFINAHYDLALFTKDGDNNTILLPNELKTQLGIQRISHSKALPRTDFRNIIQGHAFGHSRKETGENRGLISQYSFTDSANQLYHIEKIVTGMFARNPSFKDFLTIIVDYLSKDSGRDANNSDINLSGDRDIFAQWPAHFKAYTDVMKHTELMEEVKVIDGKLVANKSQHQELHAKFIALQNHNKNQEKVIGEAQKELAEQRKKDEASNGAKIEALQKVIGEEKSAFEQAEERLAKLDKQSKAYEDEGIAAKAELVDKLEATRTERGQLHERHQTLIGDSAGISARYADMKLTVKNQSLAEATRINAQINAVGTRYEPLIADNRKELEEATAQLHTESALKVSAIQAERTPALELVGALKARFANPVADSACLETLNRKQGEQSEKQAALQSKHTASLALQNADQQALNAYIQQQKTITGLERQKAALETKIEVQLSHLNPGEGSLLNFLRLNKPDWTEDIAKVIRPDILLDEHLMPTLSDKGLDVMYGLALNLGGLDSTLCADEAALQAKLGELNDELNAIVVAINDANLCLVECNKARSAADEELNLHNIEIAKIVGQIATLTGDIKAAKAAVEHSLKIAKQAATEELATLNSKITAFDMQIKQEDIELKVAIAACREKHDGIESSIKERRANENSLFQQALHKVQETLAATLAKLEQEKLQALSEKGVDIDTLSVIAKQIEQHDEYITNANKWSNAVTEWKFWCKNELDGRDELVNKAKTHRENHAKLNLKLNDLKGKWFDQVRWYKDKEDEHSATLRQLASDIERIAAKIEGLVEAQYEPDAAIKSQHYDSSWTFTNLIGQLNDLQKERKTLNDALVGKIKVIKSSFNQSRGSPTEQFFLTVRDNHDSDDSNHAGWVAPLRSWYDAEHARVRQHLLLQAVQYGMAVASFNDDLIKFGKQIKNFNNEIQESLKELTVFRCITSLNIKFKSLLDTSNTLKYWEPVKEFTDIFRAWQASGRELPPPEFATALDTLVDCWSVKEGIRVDRSKLITIEGDVVENGHHKEFRTASDLDNLSSNGLSYLIMCTIFVAFIRKIRGTAQVQITWSVDELLNIHPNNIYDLVRMLNENGIKLFSACPTATPEIKELFGTIYEVDRSEGIPELISYDPNVLNGDSHV